MTYYLPLFRPQRSDPVETHATHEGSNCLMASGAMALDYHTRGRLQVWGGDLRHRQMDLEGGTDLRDLRTAWGSYGETLDIRTGQGWAGVLAALTEGRGVLLCGDSGELDGSCAEIQDVEHGIFVHPDRDAAGRYRYGDPWCALPGWKWATPAALKLYATPLGMQFAVTAAQEGVMAQVAITSETAALIDTPAGAPLYDLDGTTKLTTLSDAFASRTSPYGVGPKRAIFVTISGVRRVALVTPTAIRLSSTTGDCTPAARQGWNDARQAAANAAGAAILAAVPAK